MGICARSARHTNLRVSMSVPLSILYLLIINLMEFLKVWAKHNFYYIRYISVYIQPRYFYLIFRSVNGNNMNRVILHSVRPSFWKKRAFSHAPRCGSTESGCEISVPWWLILADLGKMTSVWSRDRDTGDTSETLNHAAHIKLGLGVLDMVGIRLWSMTPHVHWTIAHFHGRNIFYMLGCFSLVVIFKYW